MSDDRGLFEESRLRAALRLDADEIPPRLDPVLIAAASRSARPTSDVLPTAAVAFAAGWIVSETWRAALAALPSIIGENVFGIAIDAMVSAVVTLAPAAAVAAGAALPLGVASAALIVIALGQRRTHA